MMVLHKYTLYYIYIYIYIIYIIYIIYGIKFINFMMVLHKYIRQEYFFREHFLIRQKGFQNFGNMQITLNQI